MNSEWKRMHPATVLELLAQHAFRSIFGLLFIFTRSGGGFGSPIELLVGVLLLAPAVTAFLTTRWALDADRVLWKRGLLFRQHRELSKAQVQAVDTRVTFFGRVFGLETIVVSSAGGGDSEIELGLLDASTAAEVRAELTPGLGLAAPTEAGSPPPSNGAEGDAATSQADQIEVYAELETVDLWRVFKTSPGFVGLGRVVEAAGLRAVRFGQRVQTRHGLLRIETQEARVDRLVALGVDQRFFAQRQGVEQLSVATADVSGQGATASLLLDPLAPAGRWVSLAEDLIGSTLHQGQLVRVPPQATRRARLRALRRWLAMLACVLITSVLLGAATELWPRGRLGGIPIRVIAGLVVVLLGVQLIVGQWLAIRATRRHKFAVDATHIAVQRGGLGTSLTVAPLYRTQSVTIRANWFQRRAGLVSMVADLPVAKVGSLRIVDLAHSDARVLADAVLGRSDDGL